MYAPISLPMPFPPLPGGYAWPNIYHINPMVAAAYNGQYIPAVCNRGQPFPINSQNQTTAIVHQTAHVSTPVVNSNRSSKTRSHPKQVKSH